MTLWENVHEINEFYQNGTHLKAMKQSKTFSSKIQALRIQSEDLISWKEAKLKMDTHDSLNASN